MTLLETIAAERFREPGIPVIVTTRLVLRPPDPTDAKAIAALLSDRRIAQNTIRVPYPYSLEDANTFLRSANTGTDEIVFLVTAGSGAVLGCCGIARLDGQQPELGYWLGVRFWGKGFATEAARAVIDYGFSDLGYDTLVAGARVSNPASRRVLEKCGFQWTGVALHRIRALGSSAPFDRFQLDRDCGPRSGIAV